MSVIGEINKSLTAFPEQQTIYEAQVKSFRKTLLRKAEGKSCNKPSRRIKIPLPHRKKIKDKRVYKKGSKGKSTVDRKRKVQKKNVNRSLAQKEVLEYFQRCNYSFKDSVRGRIKFKRFKNVLLEISKRDPELYEKFKSAKDIEEVKSNLPKQESMMKLIKLHTFDLNSSKDHPLSSFSSIYAISIPMGGRNK